MKLLYVTTIGGTMYFFKRLVRELLDRGHTVDIACNEEEKQVPDCFREWGCRIFSIECARSPFSAGNVRAVKRLRSLVEENGYDIVHCHTPIASACARIACSRYRKKGLKVFYTSHGFHFYKGAPLKNWLIYYPVEKLCARMTDVMLTINHEDYERAQRKMKVPRIEYVPGVGIEWDRFTDVKVDRKDKRAELGIPADAFVLISVGEVNRNKNHQIVIRAIAQLKRPEIHYIIAGSGPLTDELKQLGEELGIRENLHILGSRQDVSELFAASDVNVFPSLREGLGLAGLEGMAAGLPLICADNRGTREYATGYERDDFHGMCRDLTMYAAAIEQLADDQQLYEELSKIGPAVAEGFSTDRVNEIMLHRIYQVQ